MSGSDFASQLRALAVLEQELDAFIAKKVASAKEAGLSWQDIARVMGLSQPAAWRRWHSIVDEPRSTRARRGGASPVLRDENEKSAALQLTEELLSDLLDRKDDRPWATAVHNALIRLRLRADVQRKKSTGETVYFVREPGLVIVCAEPNTTHGDGGLVVSTLPGVESARSGESRHPDSSLIPDGMLPVTGDALTQDVMHFLRPRLEALGWTPAPDANRPRRGRGVG